MFVDVIQLGLFILAMGLILLPIIVGIGYAIVDRYFIRLMDIEKIKMEAFIEMMRKCFRLPKVEKEEDKK